MQFALEGKALRVTAETPREVLEIIEHYRLDTLAYADALASGNMTHVVQPGSRDNATWFEAHAELGAEWIAPYLAKLTHLTGYTDPVPEIDAPRYSRRMNLCHTHIVQRATLSSCGLQFSGFQCSQDWNGRTAADRAPTLFAGYVAADCGDTKHEPEFIQAGNAQFMKRNPDYLKRHAPHPAATSAAILECLMQWWLDTHATAGQRDVISRCMANHHTVCKSDTMGAYFLRMYDRGYRTDWSGPLVSFEEFRELP